MPHYHFQMIKSSKGRKNKLEGLMWPVGFTCLVYTVCQKDQHNLLTAKLLALLA